MSLHIRPLTFINEALRLSGSPFVVVVYGVDKCPQNTSHNVRLQRDTDAVTKIFGNIEVTTEPSLILDCYCLGKYNPQKSKPRPILVTLQRAIDASSILANRGQLSSPISVKPYMSPAELEIGFILLKEKWSLIQASHQYKSIRINRSSVWKDREF